MQVHAHSGMLLKREVIGIIVQAIIRLFVRIMKLKYKKSADKFICRFVLKLYGAKPWRRVGLKLIDS